MIKLRFKKWIMTINAMILYVYLILSLFQKIKKKLFIKNGEKEKLLNKNQFSNQRELEKFLNEHVLSGVNHFCIHISIKALKCSDFEPLTFLRFLKMKAGDGLLLIPLFTMRTTQYAQLIQENIAFHKDLISTGYLSKLVYDDPDFEVFYHPTHSYAVLKNGMELKLKPNAYQGITTGGSPLKLLHDLGGKIINLGVGLNQTTFMHCIEEASSNFPFHSLTKPITGTMYTYNQYTMRSFCIAPLKPNLHLVRDCDYVRNDLKKMNALKEFSFKDVNFQKIDMQLLYKSLEILSAEGKTIYGRFLPVEPK